MINVNKHRYYWYGINSQGVKLRGNIEAVSTAFVKKELGKQAIIVKKIKRKSDSFFTSKITQGKIALFFRQLATMLKAGIPLIQAFNFVAKSQNSYWMRQLIIDIQKEIVEGSTFFEALEKHPKYFNNLVSNLIAAGEKSGKLDLMLEKVADYKEKIESLKKKLQKALAYPIFVLLVAFLVTLILLIFVVPEFESLFISFSSELPSLTQEIICISRFLKNNWLIIFTLLCSLIFIFNLAKNRSLWLNHTIDKLSLKIPLLGDLIAKAIIARFARTLAIGFAAGLPLVDALTAVGGITGNLVFAQATELIKAKLLIGQQLHRAMLNCQLFPNMAVQMVAIGEESGTLDLMLTKIADFYEEEVNNSLELTLNMLEPIIMTIMGLIIGCLVIAMYLPIFKLGSVI